MSTSPEPEPAVLPPPPRAWSRFLALGRREVLGWAAFLATLLAGAAHRAWFVLVVHRPRDFVWSDMGGYVDRAWNLANPGIRLDRFDTFYPPGTHVLMAPLMRVAASKHGGIAANEPWWWLLSVLALLGVGLLAVRLFRTPWAAVVAVGGLLFHWSFTAYTGFYMSENPFSAFMLLALLAGLMARDQEGPRRGRSYAVAGLLAGVATVIRPQFGLGAVLMGLPLLRRTFPFVRGKEAAALAGAFLLPCAAAMGLNASAAKTWVGMSGNAGFNFYQGHCDVVHVETHQPGIDPYYAFAAPVRLQRVERAGLPETHTVIPDHMAWDNGYFFGLGWRCIQADGWNHAARVWTNVADLFTPADPWPANTGKFARHSALCNKVYCWGLLLLLPASVYLARRRQAERWLLLQLSTLLPVAVVFYGDSRYRVPYDVFGFLLLAGVVTALARLRQDVSACPPAPSGATGSPAGPAAAP